MRPFRYLRPSSLQEVIGCLEQHGAGARLLAGGTDLTVELHYGQSLPQAVIDIKRAIDLSPVITEADGWLTISATVPLTEVEGNKTVRRCFPALAEAAAGRSFKFATAPLWSVTSATLHQLRTRFLSSRSTAQL